MGIGFGVITGTALKTIALQEKSGQIVLPNWVSFKQISLPTFLSFKPNQLGIQEEKDLNVATSSQKREIKDLSRQWRELASKERNLKASGFLLSIDDGRFAGLAPNAILPAASAIKIPILLTVLKMLDSGQLRWDEPLKLSKEEIGGGSGWMAYQPIGKSFPVHEVATEMIRVSDNTATNLLIKRIGGIQILNEYFKTFELPSTEVKNWLPDLEGTNTTSARDLARTIAIVDSGEILSQRTRDLFREVMGTSKTNRLLPGGLLQGLGGDPRKGNIDYKLLIKGYKVYNKTGDIGIAYADAGLIQMPNNKRAVAGFIVKGPFNDPRSAELIRSMAAAMVPVLEPNKSIEIER